MWSQVTTIMSYPTGQAVSGEDNKVEYPIISKNEIERIVGLEIVNETLYQPSFIHKSALKYFASTGIITESYERLEFIGDSVINFIVTRYIYAKYKDQAEGFLTRIRTKLVSGTVLSKISKALGLQEFIVMNERGLANGWNANDRILEDVFEAFVGCLYLDVGLMAAITFVERVYESYIDFEDILRDNNYKDILMRHTQANNIPLPEYQSLDTVFDGKKIFEVHCWVNKIPCGYGRHRNKKQAEQRAAYQALIFHNIIDANEPACFTD